MPLGPARMNIYLSLENLRRMFHTTAFEHPQEYKQESADYVENLTAFEEFIAEAKSTQ